MLGGISTFVALFATAAIAQSPPSAANKRAQLEGDDNKIVCQKQEQIGTRLAPKKVCMTVREWRDRELANREETERAQTNAWHRDSN
jgi:hypothetical protein